MLTDRCELIIRTTTWKRVREQGLLGPIWDQVLPHSKGTNLTPCRTLPIRVNFRSTSPACMTSCEVTIRTTMIVSKQEATAAET